MPTNPYRKLEQRFHRLLTLRDAEEMLQWDMETVMPSGGADARAEQLAALKAVRHGILTAPDTGDLLAAAEADAPGEEDDGWRAANLREMRRTWTHATALSEDLVVALSKAASTCVTAWRAARPAADFKAVLPALRELLERVREAAAAKAERLGLDPYDALLDEYEPNVRCRDIDPVFGELEEFLPAFLAEVLEHQGARAPALVPEGPFPIDRQRALAVRLMETLGFDFTHGRLDVSLHPFCGGTPEDVRITTRYDEADFTTSLMGVLHETGHALYERGLPSSWRHQPVGEARGMAMHESQSLLTEMQVCRSREFLNFAAPIMAGMLDGNGPAWTADNLFRLYTKVEPGYIRVDADEVTYPIHVILRYRLEKAMIDGDLDVGDLPAAWDDAMECMLGLRPPDDRLGCLQDIHWYDGALGYFPTYTLGAITAAQLFDAAVGADPDIKPAIERGDFTPLMAWLGEHVHAKASLLPTRELLVEATGRPLEIQTFKRHLRQRYLS